MSPKTIVRLSSICILVLATAMGCAQPPKEQIDSASAAMDAAQSAGAAEYAPESWAAAQEAEAQLEAELAAQQQAFALSRSYDDARSMADDLKTAADRAAAEAAERKETARNDAARAIEDAKALHAEVQKLLETAPQGKGSVADLAALRADTGTTAETIAAAESELAAGRFLEALAKAQAATQSLQQVKQEIESAHKTRARA
jgi:hypothetical protein